MAVDITLRDYQWDALVELQKGWPFFKRQLLVIPTGGGKTIIFALAAAAENGRTLILVHRQELAQQAYDKINMATGIRGGMEIAGERAGLSKVVIASVQTMARGLDRWGPDVFDLIICDEAHHSISGSWQTVLKHFNGRVLGVTATPDRGDKRNLGTFYDNIAYEIGLFNLVDKGFLCPIEVKTIPVKIDLNGVESKAGDFDENQVADKLEPLIPTLAASIVHECMFRKTLIFVPLIRTSEKLAAECLKRGLRIRHIDGCSADRADLLRHFADNRIEALSNASLLVEGYDCPDIDCIVVLRPTRSRPLYAQMVGRGTRVASGKRELLILDYLWLHQKHHVSHPADLIADTEEEAQVIKNLIISDGRSHNLQQAMDITVAAREKSLRDRLKALSKKKGKFISAQEFAFMHGDVRLAGYAPVMQWESDRVTIEQSADLKKIHVDPDSVSCKGHARAILSKHHNERNNKPASDAQRYTMRKAGYPNWRNATAAEARDFFAKKTNWRKHGKANK